MTAIVLILSALAADPSSDPALPVAPAAPVPAPGSAAASAAAKKLASDLTQLARCNPFRPLFFAPKAEGGEAPAGGASEKVESESTKKEAVEKAAADTFASLRKSLVVTAIVSTDHSIYAVIGGKKYLVGDEVAPRVRITHISPSGITLSPTEDAPLPETPSAADPPAALKP